MLVRRSEPTRIQPISMKPIFNPLCIASFAALAAGISKADISGPYTADADTVYLYHFSEAVGATSAVNTGSAGFPAIPFDGDPSLNSATDPQPVATTVLGAVGRNGFGNAANISAADFGIGVDANGSGAFQTGPNAGASPDALLQSSLAGPDGSFTLEAMINLPSALGMTNYEILCTDISVGTRGFQFRINSSTADKRLEFNFIGTADTPAILASLPTSGPHVFIPNTWFHVAMVFNGTTNDVKFYWTKVDPAFITANEIGTPPYIESTLGTVSGPLIIGNEARGTSTEGLRGLIDEVRISKVARTASQFIFVNQDADLDGLQDSWEVLHFILSGEDPVADRAKILARYSGIDDPDTDTFNNAAEFAAGSDPSSAASTPLDLDADGLPDIWEQDNFGNLSETGAGDPDQDFSTNAEEFAADTSPVDYYSWPDTDNGVGDGLADGWERHYFGNITAQISTGDPDNDGFTNDDEFYAVTDPAVTFSSPDTDLDGLADGWEVFYFIQSGENPIDNLFDIITRQDGIGDPDGDGSDNEAEETGGSDPKSFAMRPYDLDSDGLVDAWETRYFGNTASQTATGNADGDSFANLQEQTAGSNPALAESTPDDTDGDGVPNTAESRVPYAVDANTLHLWDLDGIAVPVVDRVYGSSNLSLPALAGGATLSNPSFSGFGSALTTNFGFNTLTGAYLAAKTAAAGAADTVNTKLAGTDGAFTYEAMVRLDFDPLATTTGLPRMQIISAEDDGGLDTNRAFQFALSPVGTLGNTDTTPRVVFINIDTDALTAGQQAQTMEFPVPATGENVPVQGQWYHVAVAYDGVEATAENLKFYWTRLDSSSSAANLIGSAQMNGDLPVAPSDFCIGNETRDTGGQSGAFQGLIDQVRVSDIARPASAFMFGAVVGDSDHDKLPDDWETTHFGNLDQTAIGDYEGDGTSNLAEYLLGLNPKDGASRFSAKVSGSNILWQGKAGLSFVVQRSADLTNGSWTNVSTQTGVEGANSYIDPSPLTGKAFYRVLLVMP